MTVQDMLDQARGGSATVAEGWGQGRATYGGVVAGIMLAAVKGALPEGADAPLRSMTVSFVAPVVPGPADVEATVLRSGRSATQMQALLRQDGGVGAAMLASFGGRRDSAIAVAPTVPMPELPDPLSVDPFPAVEGVTPGFWKHVEMRLAEGTLPFEGAPTSHLTGWMRLRETTPDFDEEHLVTVADAWPPAVLQMLETPAPASTLTWTLEIIDDVRADPSTLWVYDVRTDQAADGYAHTHAHLWHPDGRLVAISRQTVAVFG